MVVARKMAIKPIRYESELNWTVFGNTCNIHRYAITLQSV